MPSEPETRVVEEGNQSGARARFPGWRLTKSSNSSVASSSLLPARDPPRSWDALTSFALASTYSDFLKPTPSTGWDQLDQYESLNLLQEEEAAERERKRLEKEQQKVDKEAQKQRSRLKRRERFSSICGDGKQRWVFILFAGLIVLGLLLYFLLPRAPGVDWGNQTSTTALTSTNTSGTYSTTPTNFDFSAQVAVDFDARGSYIPTKLYDLEATIYDLETTVQIGTGKLEGSTRLPGRSITTITMPLLFQMSFTNTTDTTYSDVIRSCTNSGRAFPLTLSFTYKISGVIGTKSAKLQSQDLTCPVTLSLSS